MKTSKITYKVSFVESFNSVPEAEAYQKSLCETFAEGPNTSRIFMMRTGITYHDHINERTYKSWVPSWLIKLITIR